MSGIGTRTFRAPGMSIGEFAIIEHYFEGRGALRDDVRLGIGDDAAVLAVAADRHLVTALATFGAAAWDEAHGDGARLGNDVMAAALNRLVAAGAHPAFATLSLTLSEADERWLEAFSDALVAVAAQCGAALVGGDITRGPFAATVVGHGLLDARTAATTPCPRPGDGLYLSGILSGATAARTAMPSPVRAELGAWIRARGGAAADVSEGLAPALATLLAGGGLGASIELAGLPHAGCGAGVEQRDWQAIARRRGDMELCFTLAPQLDASLAAEAEALAVRVTRIARVDDSGERRLVTPGGDVLPPFADGWSGLARAPRR